MVAIVESCAPGAAVPADDEHRERVNVTLLGQQRHHIGKKLECATVAYAVIVSKHDAINCEDFLLTGDIVLDSYHGRLTPLHIRNHGFQMRSPWFGLQNKVKVRLCIWHGFCIVLGQGTCPGSAQNQ